MASATQHPVKVEIRGNKGEFQLFRAGKPYEIRGAGIGIVELGDGSALESLQRHGGNSFRTWSVPDTGVLDRAHELGLTVAVCLDVARERHGFDYDDRAAVAEQLERLRGLVLRHREHPALLAWIIGNELNHDYTNPRVYDAVNDISRMIHELDPNHPTTTATAGIDAALFREIRQRAPDLDFLSVQVYGALLGLADIVEAIDPDIPLMVTEWGTIGHWEVPATEWGAPIELDSTAKAARYRRGWEQVLQTLEGRLIGNYVFLWGQKQERTPTWYGLFTQDGRRTEVVDVMHELWTGSWPSNRAPTQISVSLDGRAPSRDVRMKPGVRFAASTEATDPNGDKLRYEWRLMAESRATQAGGDREEIPEDLTERIDDPLRRSVSVTAPLEPGAYRLFVYVADAHGGVAHANVPFLVGDP